MDTPKNKSIIWKISWRTLLEVLEKVKGTETIKAKLTDIENGSINANIQKTGPPERNY
jgi:hypothetical protein